MMRNFIRLLPYAAFPYLGFSGILWVMTDYTTGLGFWLWQGIVFAVILVIVATIAYVLKE